MPFQMTRCTGLVPAVSLGSTRAISYRNPLPPCRNHTIQRAIQPAGGEAARVHLQPAVAAPASTQGFPVPHSASLKGFPVPNKCHTVPRSKGPSAELYGGEIGYNISRRLDKPCNRWGRIGSGGLHRSTGQTRKNLIHNNEGFS